RRGLSVEDYRRFGQFLRRLRLALRIDDLGTALAFRLGLLGNGALHLLRQVDLLDLDLGDLDAPRIGVGVEDRLDLLVDAIALGEQLVELCLAADAAQRGLRELGGREQEVLHVDERAIGIDHAEVNDGVDLDRDVVARDHVLRGNVERDDAQIHAHGALDDRNDEHEARPARRHQPAEAKHDDPLVLVDDVHRHPQEHQREHDDPAEEAEHHQDLPRGATSSRIPSIETTFTSAVSSASPPPCSSASHSSPMTETLPRGARRRRTTATAPIIASRPVTTGLRWLLVTSVPMPSSSAAKLTPVATITPRLTTKPGASTVRKSKSEPTSRHNSPPRPRAPKLGTKSSEKSSTIPRPINAAPVKLIGTMERPIAPSRMQMAPTTPGATTPGWVNSM